MKWLQPMGVQKALLLDSDHGTPVTTEKGPAEAREHAQPLLLLWGLVFNMGHCDGSSSLRVSHVKRRTGTGMLELSSSCVVVARSSPSKQCDTVPIYCLTCQSVKKVG